jgi:hypothetical protein
MGVFKTLGICEGKKLNREQFIRGLEKKAIEFLLNHCIFRCKNDRGLRELFGGGH